MQQISTVGGKHQVRAFLTAVAVPVAAFALAASAYFGGHLPADQASAAQSAPTAEASATTGR